MTSSSPIPKSIWVDTKAIGDDFGTDTDVEESADGLGIPLEQAQAEMRAPGFRRYVLAEVTDEAIERVQRHLDSIWPDEMRRRTASDLQWGQLVATAALAAAFSTTNATGGDQ